MPRGSVLRTADSRTSVSDVHSVGRSLSVSSVHWPPPRTTKWAEAGPTLGSVTVSVYSSPASSAPSAGSTVRGGVSASPRAPRTRRSRLRWRTS